MSADDNKSTKAERDAAQQAVLDNMARLKALRLAREAAMPQTAPKKKTAAKSSRTASGGKTQAGKPTEKSPALSAWLAEQRKGGFRT
ncbi:hypothetical protein E0H22_22590 [Rhodopseudomonas boonkerdii]|uniref:hypothetical protein n=1 Tax=Rhodopseudomonas boonkerdii TaxID=475937 RepID=UPI001E5DEC39|nr:hypothetical protein [Rhodopseudomonas boonkerdii]UGV28219.1 hypothetical protein E0H22_22590 [Rhodopseudomonas boonkerdii]